MIASLREKIRLLEAENARLEAEEPAANRTISDLTAQISALEQKIQTLETQISRLKSAFQQNANNVALWKQQLASYQKINDDLVAKLGELNSLYTKFGKVLSK